MTDRQTTDRRMTGTATTVPATGVPATGLPPSEAAGPGYRRGHREDGAMAMTQDGDGPAAGPPEEGRAAGPPEGRPTRGLPTAGRPVPSPPRSSAELAAAFDRHRRELHVHCYRLTGSFTDAEDLTQETFLRAWRNLDRFEGRSSLRTWLYQIATHASLDFLKRHERRTTPVGSFSDPLEHDTRIQPYPDHLIAEGADPAEASSRREATGLLFVAALTRLPPRQRAALIARDALAFSAAETAALLETSEASANSLVQRARATMRRCAPHLDEAPAGPRDDPLVRRYIEAHERGDPESIVAALHDDVRVTMPPEPPCLGRAAAAGFFRELLGPEGPGGWRLVPVRANGRPATANYLRRPGDTVFRALSIDVLETRDGAITAVLCFLDDRVFPAFGLPMTLGADATGG